MAVAELVDNTSPFRCSQLSATPVEYTERAGPHARDKPLVSSQNPYFISRPLSDAGPV